MKSTLKLGIGMKIYYLDNFRGFQNSFIPLKDVNFCVGENSSGKTSFLSLANTLSSSNFWFDPGVEGSDSGFGHFDDIVSISSKDREYFRVGYSENFQFRPDRKSAETQTGTRGFLFTFRKKNGMPKLYKCTQNFGLTSVTIYFTDKTVRYKITKHAESPSDLFAFSDKVYKRWIDEHNAKSLSGYSVMDDELLTNGLMPPMFAMNYIYRENVESADDKVKKLGLGFSGRSFDEFAWIAPIRTKPRRTYDEVNLDFSPEGQHTPYTVKRILDDTSSSKKFIDFVKKFGRESGLFKEVKVHRFSTSATSPFELDIVLESHALNISSVGYGVSQALPVVVEIFVRRQGSWFAIQQPEVHLHPRAQAAFGEMIFELASQENKKFVVETHSDFTIDRYRICHRNSDENVDAQILFFERKNGKNTVCPIDINSDGDLPLNQPESYRDFFFKEEMRVIGAE